MDCLTDKVKVKKETNMKWWHWVLIVLGVLGLGFWWLSCSSGDTKVKEPEPKTAVVIEKKCPEPEVREKIVYKDKIVEVEKVVKVPQIVIEEKIVEVPKIVYKYVEPPAPTETVCELKKDGRVYLNRAPKDKARSVLCTINEKTGETLVRVYDGVVQLKEKL